MTLQLVKPAVCPVFSISLTQVMLTAEADTSGWKRDGGSHRVKDRRGRPPLSSSSATDPCMPVFYLLWTGSSDDLSLFLRSRCQRAEPVLK